MYITFDKSIHLVFVSEHIGVFFPLNAVGPMGAVIDMEAIKRQRAAQGEKFHVRSVEDMEKEIELNKIAGRLPKQAQVRCEEIVCSFAVLIVVYNRMRFARCSN